MQCNCIIAVLLWLVDDVIYWWWLLAIIVLFFAYVYQKRIMCCSKISSIWELCQMLNTKRMYSKAVGIYLIWAGKLWALIVYYCLYLLIKGNRLKRDNIVLLTHCIICYFFSSNMHLLKQSLWTHQSLIDNQGCLENLWGLWQMKSVGPI